MKTEPNPAKTFRYDPGPPRLDTTRTAEPGLRKLFHAWIEAATRDRRAMPRHEAGRCRVWLGWWRGDRDFFALTARLDNVSRGGALLTVSLAPRETESVWICLADAMTGEPGECLATSVREVIRQAPNRSIVRLEFLQPCRTAFLEAAVCGLAVRHRDEDEEVTHA